MMWDGCEHHLISLNFSLLSLYSVPSVDAL